MDIITHKKVCQVNWWQNYIIMQTKLSFAKIAKKKGDKKQST